MSVHNISDLTSHKLVDEHDEEIMKNSLLYGIGRAFMDNYPQHYDIISSYEDALDNIFDVITEETTVDKQTRIDDDLVYSVHINCANPKILCPDDPVALKYIPNLATSPNVAVALRMSYSCVLIADIVVSYIIGTNPVVITDKTMWKRSADTFDMEHSSTKRTIVIKEGYIVQIPIPVGCKYCALRHYDEITLCRTAEEAREFYGYFIIEGFWKYIIPTFKKPFNKPIVQKNNYDNQLSRTDVIYAKKFNYENSYYIVVSMVMPKSNGAGRRVLSEQYADFLCSLQLSHPLMNTPQRGANGKKSKELWNAVPIRYLFYAFGCRNDKQMLSYIHPEMNDMLFMNVIRNACLYGYKHIEALNTANVEYNIDNNGCLRIKEELNSDLALWIIANIIISPKAKDDILKRANGDANIYRIQLITITKNILDERFMPGVGDNIDIDRNEAICIELGNIIRKLYLIGYGLEPSQDKTMLTNRRIRSGQQITREFKSFHNRRLTDLCSGIESFVMNSKLKANHIVDISQQLRVKIEQLAKIMSNDQTKSLINSFKGVSKENSKLSTDILTPKNICFVWGKLREIVITQDTSQVGAEVSWDHRKVHNDEMFFICPTQTPEAGKQAGRYKAPAIYTYITATSDPKRVIDVLLTHDNIMQERPHIKDSSHIYMIKLNGSCVGWVVQPIKGVYDDLMQARRDGRIDRDVSIILQRSQHEINIWTDTGRIVTPFVIVKNAFDIETHTSDNNFVLESTCTTKKEFSEWLTRINNDSAAFFEGIAKGFIELVCPDMCVNNCLVADCMKTFLKKPSLYTHIALPGQLNSIVTNMCPCINTLTAVRASYVTNHLKQAIGPTVRYPQSKYITTANNILIEPEVPIVRSCVYDFMHLGDHAVGQNVMVAFMQYKNNQEDSIIFNRASVEQGLLAIDSLQTYDHKIENSNEKFRIASESTNHVGNLSGYNKLDPKTCLPKDVSIEFNQFDPIIAKGLINQNNTNNKVVKTDFIDTSIINEILDGSYQHAFNNRCLRSVVKNSLLDNNELYKKVTFGRYCVPISGDKFNSEYCQKGTAGKICDVEEIPYTTNGLRPDIIFNPPSIFKRKTYGQIYYPIIAKIAAVYGCPLDLTSFHTLRSSEDVEKLLLQIGLDDGGFETMYSPITGEAFKYRIFYAPHYWERQAHLVEMKINVRNGGPRSPITGQPAKGRRRNGGQSLDKMSFDAQIASGCANIIQDFHINQGSSTLTGVCQRCNNISCYYDRKNNVWTCPYCGQHPDIIVKEIPPATNLLIGILNGAHIDLEYYDSIQTYNQANNNDVAKDMNSIQKNARIIAYKKYLDIYNFVHNIKHNVVAFGDEYNKSNRKQYNPLTIDDIMIDASASKEDTDKFYNKLEERVKNDEAYEQELLHKSNDKPSEV